jgi:UDP-N-acetylmuramate dehydrogenase
MAEKRWFDFRYRHSKLHQTGHILTEATLRLTPGATSALLTEAQENIVLRREKHPAPGTYTAGSYFKNLPPLNPGDHRRAAGMLLDRVGAKGLRVGDAEVFEKHANIIVNRGSATAQDVLTLAREMRRRVKLRFDVWLKPEVRFVGRMPEGF